MSAEASVELSAAELRELRKKEKQEKKAQKAAADKPQWGTGKKDEKKAEKVVEAEPELVYTAPGDFKDLSHPMEKAYDPSRVEKSWADWWENKGFFTPDAEAAKNVPEARKFVMCIPPPNVTGSLHIGHTLTDAIEDSLTRWHRMRGDVSLWVPGIDHAGIATQTVVERMILKEEGKTRHDYGRDAFLEKVWQWKEQYGGKIKHQTHKIGCSVDWTREAFTMDEKRSVAVTEAFVRMFEKGLIYRDTRLVSWCPHLRTALSDIEVDTVQIDGPTKMIVPGFKGDVEVGVLHKFEYKVKGVEGRSLIVATTRIETMLGDVAVAVHPDDERYKDLIGMELIHPFHPERKVVVIADGILVDPTFGTGAVKITPAHDQNDYQCGRRHHLPFINILSENGHILPEQGGALFGGLHRFEVRSKIITELTKLGLYHGKMANPMALGVCSRSGDIIEPFLIPQWWVNCKGMAARATDAVRNKELTILPSTHEQTWFKWLDNIQDWCVSRQLWWGHRIPAYKIVSPARPADVEEGQWWVVGRDEAEAIENAKKKTGAADVKLARDEDVLDTWFSSGLFPFATMGWPNKTADMEAFFPNSILETGHDILFFWVARMVMMSLELMDCLPFKTVYLHAMVRDKSGRKMSKSLGNVVDPLEIIEGITLDDIIAKLKGGNLKESELERAIKDKSEDFPEGIPACGADALRYGLLAYTKQGQNVNLDIKRVIGYRQFCNKLWNATKFALMRFPEGFKAQGFNMSQLTWADRWILSRLSAATEGANKAFENYEFSDAVTSTYNFWLYELCDVYLELLKPRFPASSEEKYDLTEDQRTALEVLYTCLDKGLRLLHPMTPFVTEELYHRIPSSHWKAESISIADYPQAVRSHTAPVVEEEMAVFLKTVSGIRSLLATTGIPPSQATIYYDTRVERITLSAQSLEVKTLSKVLAAYPKSAAPQNARLLEDVVEGISIFIDLGALSNETVVAVKTRIEKKAQTTENDLQRLEKKMSGPGYEKAQQEAKDQDAKTLAELKNASEKLAASLAALSL
eukprot:GDKK01009426.1.p1 GENE.GDKK01009426.1~~GDKK01009426.1.p1  ORF type:complete len:1042 (-),score=389.21 GDKK01009426.1:184-3285(-)